MYIFKRECTHNQWGFFPKISSPSAVPDNKVTKQMCANKVEFAGF